MIPIIRFLDWRKNSTVNWQEAEDRFGVIDGELDSTWNKYDDGPVEWYIKPVGSDTDGRREKRFIIEARWLGRKLKGRRDVLRQLLECCSLAIQHMSG